MSDDRPRPSRDYAPDVGYDAKEQLMNMFNLMMGNTDTPASQGCQETEWRGLPAQELFLAVQHGDVPTLQRLLADPEMKERVFDLDNDKMSIWDIFAFCGKDYDADDMIKTLIEAGFDVNRKSVSFKETALQFATLYGRTRVVKALLKHGARTDISDWKGDAPVASARKNCRHNRSGNHDCCQVLSLLLDAEKRLKTDSDLIARANLLREKGNRFFARKEYAKAREEYTRSLETWEDHRAFSNRALCSIQIAKQLLEELNDLTKYPKDVSHFGAEAMSDGYKSIAIDPTFVKAHHHIIVGYILQRLFARAFSYALETVQSFPNNEELKKMVKSLEDLNIKPVQHFLAAHTFTKDVYQRIKNGEDHELCEFCWSPNIYPFERDYCVHCSIPVDRQIDEAILRDLIMNA